MQITLKQVLLFPWYVLSRSAFFIYLIAGPYLKLFTWFDEQKPAWLKQPISKLPGNSFSGIGIGMSINFRAWRWRPVPEVRKWKVGVMWLCFSIRAIAHHKRESPRKNGK